VIPEMAESVGISKSSVSRETIEASGAALQALLEQRLDDKDFIVNYIDSLHCGEHCVMGAVGVDTEGHKRVLTGVFFKQKEVVLSLISQQNKVSLPSFAA
jgi:putative transposase